MDEAAKNCFNMILTQTVKPLFIAVTGDSGSGKSYLVTLLEDQFRDAGLTYEVINHDEFLISRNDREPMKNIYYKDGKFAGKSHRDVLENMFRLDEYDRVINELRSGRETSFQPYSRDTGTVLSAKRVVKPCDYIIFDTSMMLEKMDFTVLVEVSQESIINRKLRRDSDVRTPEQIIDMHKKVQGFYWEDRGRPDRVDIIVDNNDFDNVKVTVNK
jgi:uridine kinase